MRIRSEPMPFRNSAREPAADAHRPLKSLANGNRFIRDQHTRMPNRYLENAFRGSYSFAKVSIIRRREKEMGIMQTHGIDRRNFLKGSVVAGGTMALGLLAGMR